MAKCRITETVPHDSPVFWCWKSRQNSNGVTPDGGVKCNAVAANWLLLPRRVVNLVQSQVYHTERPTYLFAARFLSCSLSCEFISEWSFCSNIPGWAWFPKSEPFGKALKGTQSTNIFCQPGRICHWTLSFLDPVTSSWWKGLISNASSAWAGA